MTEDEDNRLKQELLMVDLDLRRKQAFWETPRNIAVLLGATAALAGLVFGLLGYKIGQTPPAPIIIQLQQPPAPK
jgi:hypothetical protein